MKSQPRVKRFFSPLVIIYCVCVTVVVAFIAYVAFSKTVITVTLKAQPAQYDFSYQAKDIAGTEIVVPFEHNYTFTNYTSAEEPGTAEGTVTIINNYSSVQPLVATTRLLSDSGVLFRTDETITVPAGGQVDVPVYADQPGATGNIGPSHFEIVALWDGLKDDIYGQSDAAMTGGVVKKVTMTETIVQQAKTAAAAAVKTYALQLVQAEADQPDQAVADAMVLTYDLKQVVTPGIDETGDSVVVVTTGTATTMTYDQGALLHAVSAATKTAVAAEAVAVTIQRDAAGNLMLGGSVKLPQTQPSLDFIDPATLTSRTPQQMRDQLLGFDQVADVAVQLSPAWAARTPALEQQIELRLNTQE